MAWCLICYFIVILLYIEKKWLLMRNLTTIQNCMENFSVLILHYRWNYKNAEKWLNFKKFQWKIVKHFARVKQRAAFRKLFSLSPTHPPNQIKSYYSLEQKFYYGDIQKYIDTYFQGGSRMQFLGVKKWCSVNVLSETKQNNVGWKICENILNSMSS